MQLVVPDWSDRFDFTQITWLDKEAFLDPPQGARRALDLVAQLPVRVPVSHPETAVGERWLVLVHMEIDAADSVAPLRPRMFGYYEYLRRQYTLPVLPIGLYLRVGLQGLGWDSYEETFWGQTLVRFTYPYIGSPGLEAEHYLHGDNWLAVALTALMRMPASQRTQFGITAWRRLVQCPENEYRRYLLCECVDAYLPLDDAQRQVFETTVLQDPDPGVQHMATTLFERIRQEGTLQGQRAFVQMLLTERFGPLNMRVQEQVQTMTAERLVEVGRTLLSATSLRDLGLEA